MRRQLLSAAVVYTAFASVAGAQTAPTPDPVIEAYKRQQAASEAETAMHNAAAAASNAQVAADKAAIQASIGTVTGSKDIPKDEITVEAGAGKGEATLLATQAVTDASKRLVSRIYDQVCVTDQRIVLVKGLNALQLQYFQEFKLRAGLLKAAVGQAEKQYEAAREKAKAVEPQGSRPTGRPADMAALGLAGAAVDAFAKLGSYFRSDYKIGGIDTTIDAEVLVSAVAEQLLATCEQEPTVIVPGRLRQTTNTLLGAILKLQTDVSSMPALEAKATVEATEYKAKAEKVPAKKKDYEDVSLAFARAAAAAKRASDDYAAFMARLTTDVQGITVLSRIIQEYEINDAIYDTKIKEVDGIEVEEVAAKPKTYVLELATAGTQGGYYTKTNLWTFFGTTPFYVMGSAVVNYSLVDPSGEGKLIAADVVLIHGGYAKVNDVQGRVEEGQADEGKAAAKRAAHKR
jgi:hypothetical protein